jgi:hypothetical protein
MPIRFDSISAARVAAAVLGFGREASIDDCLAACLSASRPHRMSRIAEQRHPTEAPSRERLAIRLPDIRRFCGFGGSE